MQKEKKKNPVSFTSDDSEEYNVAFFVFELKQAFQKSNDSFAVGPDDIYHKQLTNLPASSLSQLLTVINSIWESDIPPSWGEAATDAIPKPGKDSSDPNNYRTIALPSC